MTTVAELLSLSLKDIGVLGEGQTASATTIDDALMTLNQMLGLWQADALYVYAQKDVPVTLTGAASYTVGVGATISTPRPVKIDAAYFRVSGEDYPVDVLASYEDYARIGNKSAGSYPGAICYVPSFPFGTLYVYNNAAVGELHLIARVDLPSNVTLTEEVTIPPEYSAMIRYSLCEYLSTTFQTPLRPDIAALASRARKMVKRNNVRIPRANMPEALNRTIYNVRVD